MIDLVPLGDRAYLARFPAEAEARAWASAARAAGIAGVVDVVLAYRSVAVFADPERADFTDLELRLRALSPSAEVGDPGNLVRLPVLYDGEDLPDVARCLGLTPGQVIAEHSSRDYAVFAIGFLPGFPYAGYLPDTLSGLARRDVPRTRVPAGSVAIVGRQTGVYLKWTPKSRPLNPNFKWLILRFGGLAPDVSPKGYNPLSAAEANRPLDPPPSGMSGHG